MFVIARNSSRAILVLRGTTVEQVARGASSKPGRLPRYGEARESRRKHPTSEAAIIPCERRGACRRSRRPSACCDGPSGTAPNARNVTFRHVMLDCPRSSASADSVGTPTARNRSTTSLWRTCTRSARERPSSRQEHPAIRTRRRQTRPFQARDRLDCGSVRYAKASCDCRSDVPRPYPPNSSAISST